MKLKTTLLILIALAGAAFGQSFNLTPLLNYQTVNGSATCAVATVTSRLPTSTLYFQSGGITNAGGTNALPSVSYVSLDGVNFVPFATNSPPSTNAGVYPYSIAGALPVYLKTVVTTTNPLSAGVMFQK